MHAVLKLALDLGPLAAFFLGYKLFGLMAGTSALIVLTLVSLGVTYAMERKIAMAPLISGVLVALFGGVTLLLHDETYIKMKPTAVNLLFAAILLGGVCARRGLLRHLLEVAFQLTDEGWVKLSFRWGIFFLALAVLNEIIWRHFSTDFWVNFKVFGMLTLTVAFTISQLPLVKRYSVIQEE